MPEISQPAPDFTLPVTGGGEISLSDLRGKAVVLYFYPRDDTPGCTKQACNLRDHTGDLTEAGVAVVGVSADPVESHERFAAKYDLPFPLLADPEREILEAYGAWGEKNLYGRKSMGTKRTTFLIGADGRVIHVFKRPKTDRHAEEILAKLPD